MAKRNNFIERSLVGALSFFKDSVFAEEYALKNGFLQVLDPRLKIISFAILFITAIFLKSPLLLGFLYLACLALVIVSRVNFFFFLKRTWIFIPLFSLFIAVPAVFNIFSPGETIATINFFGSQLAVTKQGLQGAGLFVLRVLVSVSFVVVLTLTTRHTVLLRALRVFKVPEVFIMTLGMCYRYIYLFVEIIENTYLSIKSRTGGIEHYKKGQKIVSWNIACLWQRSYEFSREVYDAMLSRGYTGEPVTMDDFESKAIDWWWLATVLSTCALLLNFNFRMA